MKEPLKGSTQSKKAAVLNANQRRMNPLTFIIGGAALMAALGLAFYLTDAGPSRSLPATAAQVNVSQVSHPVSLFNDGKAHHFSHRISNDITVKYFVIKSSDGVIRAAFDACDVCWPAGKGYYQDGDDMVCRNCGRRFSSIRINEVKGGCNPAPLIRNVVKDKLVIKVDDIRKGHIYFDFKGA